ncbi:MAG: enoyl-CoA hydratase/isomerase family protein [Myxococcota bacterium]|nr:enoyl-CoA hydratase/isomerase family protein [Myxococcota bacterium]
MQAEAYDYTMIAVEVADGVAWATVDNPPINLITLPLFGELRQLGQQIEADDDVRVLILRSANPDFFLAHFDVSAILEFPTDGEAKRSNSNAYHALCENYKSMDKVTLAQIEGRVGGGGSELAMSFDMRFGVLGRTRINQMEVPIGILPGGSGTQSLPSLVGRGRALEIILGAEDLDAATAEQWGYLNRALPAEEIGPFVDQLARRIAGFPPEAVRLAKQAVGHAQLPAPQGLIEETYLFDRLLRTDDAQNAMRKFLALGGQTPEGEAEVARLSGRLQKG